MLSIVALAGSVASISSTASCQAYLGHEVEAITFAQAKAGLPVVERKGPYESTAEYERRLASTLGSKPLIVISSDRSEGLSYNPDRQELTVYPTAFGTGQVNLSTVFGIGSRGFDNFASARAFRVGVRETSQDTYDASNAFGARAVVNRTYRNVDTIWEASGRYGQSQFVDVKPFGPVARLTVPAETARDIVEHASAAFLIKPRAPFLATGTSVTEPSFRNPVERRDTLNVLIGDVQCAFLLTRDGRVALALSVK
jgi:hypothetical protein